MTARALRMPWCDHRRMVKHHPKRPHLKAWRIHMGRTQEWLANELGTSHSTVLRQERQETGVDDQTFQAIADAYGITPAELSANPSDREKAKQLDRLLNAIRNMDSDGVALIAGFAERLKPTS
ncbi:helix-turn-helix domain-containing protein [Roseomonas xinghualingensis]|uniref:helix-turn-helix domain-containing protein n=2 Tax=Roseomonas xinghualingensis TaxID=2986475 RepID=UPI00298DF30C|nr:helix-turn-helix transcriptional regulator [Roseomonas sp. SXEYE001]